MTYDEKTRRGSVEIMETLASISVVGRNLRAGGFPAEYLAGNIEPDFIWPEGKIAIELTGWIDETPNKQG
jgi:hypothetical protein